MTAVDTAHNSYYARAFLHFEQQFMSAIDRRTTVVILGDGRTNYQATRRRRRRGDARPRAQRALALP